MKAYWGSGGIAPLIFYLGSRWRWVVSFTPRPLYPQGKSPFGPKRAEDESWEKLHNDELHSLYSSPNVVRVIKSRRMRWAGHVARMGKGRDVCRILVQRPEGKIPLWRPRCRWEDNIKMDLREMGIDGANWIRLAQDRVQCRAFVSIVMNLRVL
jgi:hypothetical protein